MVTAAPASEPKKRFQKLRDLATSAGTQMSGAGPFIKKHKRWFTFIGAFGVRDVHRQRGSSRQP